MVRPIRQAHGPEALEGQAHHPEQGRRIDGVSKGENKMSILVVGTVAFDSIETPYGSAERILGGSKGENKMSILVVGTVAFDSIETPTYGSAERILGGSASYFAMAA